MSRATTACLTLGATLLVACTSPTHRLDLPTRAQAAEMSENDLRSLSDTAAAASRNPERFVVYAADWPNASEFRAEMVRWAAARHAWSDTHTGMVLDSCVAKGMTPEMVAWSWGNPDSFLAEHTDKGRSEQWIWGDPLSGVWQSVTFTPDLLGFSRVSAFHSTTSAAVR